MTNLVLFKNDSCPYCRKVLNFINENNISDIEVMDIVKNPENKKYLIENGGKNQVPCLFIDEEAMYESENIIAYLAKRLINPNAIPKFKESLSESDGICPLW